MGTEAKTTKQPFTSRCQVDTPFSVIRKLWQHVHEHRHEVIDKVVDFGAGDGRFALAGRFGKYVGFEIDPDRLGDSQLPPNAIVTASCAFSVEVSDADLCVGNPPYIKNQALPEHWKREVAQLLHDRTGVRISGLANAWQYFFLLSIASAKPDGLVALVVPYEWVSRPSCAPLRGFLLQNRWGVEVYRLRDATFEGVLTTSSITIIDKAQRDQRWTYWEEDSSGRYCDLPSAAVSKEGVLKYVGRRSIDPECPYAKRGLSPGTQRVLVLTERLRTLHGLCVDEDVVPCITSLRPLPMELSAITNNVFEDLYVSNGLKCWLVRTDREPTGRLAKYLGSVDSKEYQTRTCLARDKWWQFAMPDAPQIIAATGFTGPRPKAVVNHLGARAVGGVAGIYRVAAGSEQRLVAKLAAADVYDRIVPHANEFRKIEINQLNALIRECFSSD